MQRAGLSFGSLASGRRRRELLQLADANANLDPNSTTGRLTDPNSTMGRPVTFGVDCRLSDLGMSESSSSASS